MDTKQTKQLRLSCALLFCTIAGILLGLSQPLIIKSVIEDIGDYQDFLGLLALVAYVPWFLAVSNASLRKTFWLSLYAATLQYTIILYWIYIALNLYGDLSPLASSAITLLLASFIALQTSLAFTLARYISIQLNYSFLAIAAIALCALEYFRNYYLFGGFPWGNVGYSLGRVAEFLQLASLFGVYGLVFFVGLVNALIAYLIYEFYQHKRLRAGYFTALIMLLASAYIFGFIRLRLHHHEGSFLVRVALLQGNIDQKMKSASQSYADEILSNYLLLNKEAKAQGAELVVWPESAYPKSKNEDLRSFEFNATDNVASIIGASAFGYDKKDAKGFHYHNAAFISDYRGYIKKRYDKSHLVPFGEYVPWPFVGIVDKIVPGVGAFVPGTEYEPFSLALSKEKSLNIGTSICYEGIFPEIGRAYKKNGAELLINITNDAWYGFSSAPYQHLLMYRLRAVENGLTFLRATNSGVSAVIDQFGNIKKRSGLFERTLIVEDIRVFKKATLYTVIGDILPILITLLFLLGFIASALPIKKLAANPPWLRLCFFLLLIVIALIAKVYFGQSKFLTDESANTKALVIFSYCLIIGIGLLSNSERSQKVLKISALFLTLFSLMLVWFESWRFIVGLIVGILIYTLSFCINTNKVSN